MDDENIEYEDLVARGRELAGQGKVRQAVEACRKAYKIIPNEKLKKKIKKMEFIEVSRDMRMGTLHSQAYLAENSSDDSEEEGSDMVPCGDGFFLHKDLVDKLYDHQRKGVLWLWGLHNKRRGGILGDDMGLGKTIQVISFLSGLFDLNMIRHVLIVMPLSLIPNWERELEKWAPGIQVVLFHGAKRERQKTLHKFMKRDGVCLTSYGTVSTSWEDLSKKDGREFVWDYVILDEGHKIKNTNKTSKSLHAVPAKHRIILTGTPIQNNLKELWSLFDFVHWGRLLGTQKTFKMEYETPISQGREKDASAAQKRLGLKMSESLKKIISPYFLARTKAQVRANENKNDGTDLPQMPTLSRKNDLVVWVYLSEAQVKIYHDFNSLDSVKELLMLTNKSPLVALTVLKKICDHPRLLSKMACKELGLYSHHINDDDEDEDDGAWNQVELIPPDILVKESGKLKFLVDLMEHLREHGNRCLIFSQSRKMLDIIYKVLDSKGFRQMRLDGTVKHLHEREELVQRFQKDSSVNAFLLTTQVGGVGLTLTGADRVVIFDPSWNPATDAQAVDRAFRIGQQKNVVIYRLISCGSVEEKIYRRQIFKDSITKQTTGTGGKDPYRYFTRTELRELFAIDDPHHSSTQRQLEEMHSQHRLTDPELDGHLAYLHSIGIFGLSDHDLMFSKEVKDHEMEQEDDYIDARVQRAAGLIALESEQAENLPNARPMNYSPPKRPRQDYMPTVRPENQYQPPPSTSADYDPTDSLNDSIDDLHLQDDSVSDHDEVIDVTPAQKPKEVITLDSDDDEPASTPPNEPDHDNHSADNHKPEPDHEIIKIKTEKVHEQSPYFSRVKAENEMTLNLKDVKTEKADSGPISPMVKYPKRVARLESDSPLPVTNPRKRVARIESDSERDDSVLADSGARNDGHRLSFPDNDERQSSDDDVEEFHEAREEGQIQGTGSERVTANGDIAHTPSKIMLPRTPGKTPSRTEAKTHSRTPAKTPSRTPARTPLRTPSRVQETASDSDIMKAVTPIKAIQVPDELLAKRTNTPSRAEMSWLVDNSDEEEQCQAELSAIVLEEEDEEAVDEQEVVEESFRTGSRNLFESSDVLSEVGSSRNATPDLAPVAEESEVSNETRQDINDNVIVEKDADRMNDKVVDESMEAVAESRDEATTEREEFEAEDMQEEKQTRDEEMENDNEETKDEPKMDKSVEQEEAEEDKDAASSGEETDMLEGDETKTYDTDEEKKDELEEEAEEDGNENEELEEEAEDEEEDVGEEEEEEEEESEEGSEEESDEMDEETENQIRAYKQRAKELCNERDYVRAYKYAYAAYKLAPDDDKIVALLTALKTRLKKQQKA